jgi:PEP-CTERM motif
LTEGGLPQICWADVSRSVIGLFELIEDAMGILKTVLSATALAASLAFAGGASAGVIPYPNPGTSNLTVYTFTAATTGDIHAFFVGSSAGLEENIGLLVNGVPTGVTGLNNHTSSVGDEVDLGSANAGDILTFLMFIPPAANSTGPFTWSSDPTQNSDGIQHIYSTDVVAGQAYAGSPAGTYVGWEDLPNGGDFDYNDDQYLFVNVRSAVPEASTWAMMLAGFAGLAFAAFRRTRKTGVSAAA